MAENFSPLALDNPRTFKRKKENRNFQFDSSLMAQRKIFARTLIKNIKTLDKKISKLSEDQKKAVFLKLQHDALIPLIGTGLKAISDPDQSVTLAILTKPDLA